MPILESPEVYRTSFSSGLEIFEQKLAIAPASGEYDTDIGLTGPLGMNPICNTILLHDHQLGPDCLTMTINLREMWAGKNGLIETMASDGIQVTEHTGAWGDTSIKLSVQKARNILALGDRLRTTFGKSSHEGADIYRPLLHPALLGEVMDHVAQTSRKSPVTELKGWGAHMANYGWRC